MIMFKIIAILILPLIAFSQVGFIPISCDYASFHSTDSLAYIEIYVSTFQGSIQYSEDEPGVFTASFTNTLVLSDDSGPIDTLVHNYRNSFQDTLSAYKYNQFIDIFAIEVPYGSYKAKSEIVDNTSLKKGEYLIEINTITPEEGLLLSDIELCTKIVPDTIKSIYHKNGLKVVPNPRRIFDVLQPMLYFYVELNNLSHDINQQNQYEFGYAIVTTDGDTVKTRKPILKNIAGPKLVEIGALNVMALPSNNYFIVAKAKDIATNKEVINRSKFQVYKPSTETQPGEQDQNAIITGIYGEFTREDLKNEFAVAKYLATRDEEKVFNKLETAEAMKSFLLTFWQAKDIQFRVQSGEFRKIYMNRVEIANERFRTMGREGWKTDRGRVLLLYGEPNEYERFPSSMDALPYIIWHYYDLEGSQFFVFTDMDGFGDYRQIHSTYRKELQNPNWESVLSKSSGSGGF